MIIGKSVFCLKCSHSLTYMEWSLGNQCSVWNAYTVLPIWNDHWRNQCSVSERLQSYLYGMIIGKSVFCLKCLYSLTFMEWSLGNQCSVSERLQSYLYGMIIGKSVFCVWKVTVLPIWNDHWEISVLCLKGYSLTYMEWSLGNQCSVSERFTQSYLYRMIYGAILLHTLLDYFHKILYDWHTHRVMIKRSRNSASHLWQTWKLVCSVAHYAALAAHSKSINTDRLCDQWVSQVKHKTRPEVLPYASLAFLQYPVALLAEWSHPSTACQPSCIYSGQIHPMVLTYLTNIFNNILKTKQIPDSWHEAKIVILFKNGDPKDIKNYRPISLLSHSYKIFTRLLQTRIERTLDENQPREQAGFRKGYSTTDHLQALNQIIEKSNEYNLPLCTGFIDYEKAFDTVEHFAIFEALRKTNVNKTYINILQNIYNQATARVHLDKLVSTELQIHRGVRQGDPLSPKLFTAVMEEVFKKAEISEGVNVDGENLSNLKFADDVALLNETTEQMEKHLNNLNSESLNVGLKIHKGKTSTWQTMRTAKTYW